MPEQQYKKEIEEILRLADESEEVDSTDVGFMEEPFVFQFYLTKLKNKLKLSLWPLSPGFILLVSLITLLSSIALKFLFPSVAHFAAFASLFIFIVGYATFFIARK